MWHSHRQDPRCQKIRMQLQRWWRTNSRFNEIFTPQRSRWASSWECPWGFLSVRCHTAELEWGSAIIVSKFICLNIPAGESWSSFPFLSGNHRLYVLADRLQTPSAWRVRSWSNSWFYLKRSDLSLLAFCSICLWSSLCQPPNYESAGKIKIATAMPSELCQY